MPKRRRNKVRTLILGALLATAAAAAHAAGSPPASAPYSPDDVILNKSTTQTGKTFHVTTATVDNLQVSTVSVNRALFIGGVAVSTNIQSGTSVYPATATANFSKGFTSSTATFTGAVTGTSVTLTGLFSGGTIHGSSAVITGTITGSNIFGTNTGDVVIGTANGLSITTQSLSLALASTVSTGALRAFDFNIFNNKLSTGGSGAGLTGMNKSQVGLGSVQNVDQTVATNVVTGIFDPARLGTSTASSARYLRGDSAWAVLNSTAVGLGNVLNTAQVSKADYTQKGAILVGTSTGVPTVLAPGNNGATLVTDSSNPYGMSWVDPPPNQMTVFPATATVFFPKGMTASTGVFNTWLQTASMTVTGNMSAMTVQATTGTFSFLNIGTFVTSVIASTGGSAGNLSVVAATTTLNGKIVVTVTDGPRGEGVDAGITSTIIADAGDDPNSVMAAMYGHAINFRTGIYNGPHSIAGLFIAQDVLNGTTPNYSVEGRTLCQGMGPSCTAILAYADWRGLSPGTTSEIVAQELRSNITSNGVTPTSTGTMKMLLISTPIGKGSDDNHSWTIFAISTYNYYLNGHVGISSTTPVNNLVVRTNSGIASIGDISAGAAGIQFVDGPVTFGNFSIGAISGSTYVNRPTGGFIIFTENGVLQDYISPTTGNFTSIGGISAGTFVLGTTVTANQVNTTSATVASFLLAGGENVITSTITTLAATNATITNQTVTQSTITTLTATRMTASTVTVNQVNASSATFTGSVTITNNFTANATAYFGISVSSAPRDTSASVGITPIGTTPNLVYNTTDKEVCFSTGSTRFTWVEISTPTAACKH